MRESKADGYTLYALDPGGGLSVKKSSSGWAAPGTARDSIEVISFPLRADGIETTRLVFSFRATEIPPRSRLVLGRINEAVQAV